MRFWRKPFIRASRTKGRAPPALKTGENMNRVNVAGDLTLNGITRGMGLDAQVVAGEDMLRPQGSFSLVPSDDGLKVASVAEAL
jgi:hypothetical protein